MDKNTIKVEIRNSSDTSADDVYLQFIPNRGKILEVKSEGTDITMLSDFSYYLKFPENLQPDDIKMVDVDYVGEVATVLHKRVGDKSAKDLAEKINNKEPILEDPDKNLENFQKRRDTIDIMEDPKKKKAHKFFFELDSQSLPNLYRFVLPLKEIKKRDSIISENLFEILFSNVKKRGNTYFKAIENGTTDFIPNDNELYNNDIDVNYLTVLQKFIIEKHFEENVKLIKDFEDAFIMFVNGDLKLEPIEISTEPDSAHYFFFAEWALISINKDCEREFWEKLLRIFVMTQEIYVNVYRPKNGTNVSYVDYKVGNYDSENKYCDNQISRLFNLYKSDTISDLEKKYGKNCCDSFPWETNH